jgi:hypothetical protein
VGVGGAHSGLRLLHPDVMDRDRWSQSEPAPPSEMSQKFRKGL